MSDTEDTSAVYLRLLELVIFELRMRIREGDDVSVEEVHDLMDAVHNIPELIRGKSDWHTPQNIRGDLERYDRKWAGRNDSDLRRPILLQLQDLVSATHEELNG